MISCQNISKRYGKVQALHQVNIICNKGEICGLVGANGAGKTTLFKILLNLVSADSGTIEISGDGSKKIGGIIEKPALYPYLNARENLQLFAKVQGAQTNKVAIDNSLIQVGLPLDRNDPVRNFSMGMKQRLGIAVALLNNPSCLLLDEPFSGLDPIGIEALKKLIVHLAKTNNMAILISSHILEVLSTLCTQLFVIHNGKMVQNGPISEMISKCTKGFTLCGKDLENAIFPEAFEVLPSGDCVTITATTSEISEIIFSLSKQGVALTSCTPNLNAQQLFNPNNS